MNDDLKEFISQKLREPSTYAGAVFIAGGVFHRTLTPEEAQWLETACMIVAGCFMLWIRERRGPNPQNAPLPPQGTAPVVTAAADQTTAVLVPAPAISVQVQEKP